MNAAPIFFLEIGGTKNPGRAPSGICNCKVVNWFGVTNRRELGSWMGFMISNSLGRDSALRCPDAAARRPYQVIETNVVHRATCRQRLQLFARRLFSRATN